MYLEGICHYQHISITISTNGHVVPYRENDRRLSAAATALTFFFHGAFGLKIQMNELCRAILASSGVDKTVLQIANVYVLANIIAIHTITRSYWVMVN